MVSIATPWMGHPELLATYLPTVRGAEVVIVDNASDPETARKLQNAASIYIRNEENNRFAKASNQGIRVATNDIILCLNNDTAAPSGWLKDVESTVKPGAFYGPSVMVRKVDGNQVRYIEGHCIAATRTTWEAVGLWPEDLPGMYWEDNILCLRALIADIPLIKTNWPVQHYGNYTARHVVDSIAFSEDNRKTFEDMYRAYHYQH
jgi:GT2 family glycosyltransferase